MAKNTAERIIDQQYTTRAVRNASGTASYTVVNVLSHSDLNDLNVDDHLQYLLSADAGGRPNFLTKWTDLTDGGNATVHTHSHTILSDIGSNTHSQIDTHISASDIHVAHSGVSVIAGDGLTGGGTIAADRTLAVAVANTIQSATATGLSVEANAVRFTASYDPGATASPLASSATGSLTLPLFVASTSITTPLVASGTGQSLTLRAATDLILDPTSERTKMAAGASIEASSYASQTTGWRVTDIGEADFRYLFVDEMHAKSFIADLEQALAGGQIIAKSVTLLYLDFTAPAAGATALLTVRDLPSATGMAVFVNGDTIRLRQFNRTGGALDISDCWGTVVLDTSYGTSGFDSATKSQRYTFTRSAAPNDGEITAGTVLYAESIVLDYGTAGNGIYEVNAIDGLRALNSPYAQVATWTTHPKTMTVKSRFGNLRGIFSVDDEYGLYAGSGTGLTDRYIRAGSLTAELRNVPLALYDGSNNTLLLSAGAGNNAPFLAMGYPLPTGPLVNDGLWFGLDGSDYELRVGTVSGGALVKGLHWTGSDLVWKATNTSLDAGGNLIAGPVTLSAGGVSSEVGAYSNNSAYDFTYGGTVTAGLWGFTDTAGIGTTLSSNLWAGASTVVDATKNGYTTAGAYAQSGKGAYANLIAEIRDAYGAMVKAAKVSLVGLAAGSTLDLAADTATVNSKVIWHADMDATLLPSADVTYNIGSATKRWSTIYANSLVISGSISGATIGGAEWEHAGSMVIDANAAANTIVSIVNQNAGAYTASLDVEGNITLGGNVDGVDLSAFYTAYGSHSHSHASLSSIDANTHVAHSTVSILGGNGLTGGGAINATQTLHVAVSGLGLSVSTDAVTLASSSAGEANAHILATDASGLLTLRYLNVSGAVYSNATQTDTIFNGSPGADNANFIGSDGYWALRTGSNNSFNVDVYNSGSPFSALNISQSGVLSVKNLTAITSSGFGYSPTTYHVLVLGATSGNRTVAIGYDPSGNVNGSFAGDGREILFRNGVRFTTPNSTNNGFHTPITLLDGKIGVGDSTPSYTFDVTGTGRFTSTLYADNDLVVGDTVDVTGVATLRSTVTSASYASQTTGWRISSAGEADFRYLFTDEMHAKSFIADLEQALAGGQIIAKSVAVLYSNFTAPAAGGTADLYVRDLPSAPEMQVFQAGDTIRIRAFTRSAGSLTIADCWGTVSSPYNVTGDGYQYWLFTRSAAPNAGAMALNTVVYKDAIVLDYGTAGNGIYEVNAIDGAYGLNSPYAQIANWTTHPASMTVRTRFGNLRGITAQDNEYGLFAGAGTAVTDRYIRASNVAIELRNVPLALYDGTNNTMLLSAGASNNSPFMALGSTLPTGPLANDGIWLGKDGSDYEFRVGSVSGGALVQGMHWNGSTLNVIGAITATSGSFTGAITANSGSIAGVLTMGANGSITAGSATLNSSGINLSSTSSSWDNTTGYKFSNGATLHSGLWTQSSTDIAVQLYVNGVNNAVVVPTANASLALKSFASSAQNASTSVAAKAAGGEASISLTANSSGTSISVIGATAITGTLNATGAITQNGSQVWHAGNDGHTSTLDADTLDTYQASEFARLAAAQTWTAKQTFNALVDVRSDTVTIGVRALTATGFGYSPNTYRVVMVGAASGYESVSIGYDPSGNPNGSFTGNGSEILFRNGAKFFTPNSANTAFHNPITLYDGKVGISNASPTYTFDVVGTINATSPYRRSGTEGYLFVPLYTASLTDTASHPWDGSQARAYGQTYYFDLGSYSVPDTAKAVVIAISANWSAASQNHLMIARGKDTGHVGLVIRSHAANINNNATGIVELNSTHDLEIYISDSGVAPGVTVCRLIGYFV